VAVLVAVVLALCIAVPTLLVEKPWECGGAGPIVRIHGETFSPPFVAAEWLEAHWLGGDVTVIEARPLPGDLKQHTEPFIKGAELVQVSHCAHAAWSPTSARGHAGRAMQSVLHRDICPFLIVYTCGPCCSV
jgi:hypothetical protein